MPNKKDTNELPVQQKVSPDKVGDILHKERVTRRITLETIAKDLKLSVKYIEAIESNNLNELPADPYVRVYLRSIASYLMLDPDMILRKFFEEKGIDEPSSVEDNSKKISINVGEDNKEHSISWVIVLIVIVALAILSYVSNKMGWISSVTPDNTISIIDSTANNGEAVSDSINEEDFDSTVTEDETSSNTEKTNETKPMGNVDDNDGTDSLKLVITVKKDSVWTQVFSDGRSWKNFIHVGRPRVFRAVDSLNLHVGNNARIRYHLNNKQLNVKGGGVRTFKIDHNGVEAWKMSQWKKIFKNRL